MRDFRNKNITVFGLARSGMAAAKKLVSLGARVTVTEIRPASDIDEAVLKELHDLEVDLELGGQPQIHSSG
jgi:UDP-N-acetylmuramoylalanine--D-glutamate ligase